MKAIPETGFNVIFHYNNSLQGKNYETMDDAISFAKKIEKNAGKCLIVGSDGKVRKVEESG